MVLLVGSPPRWVQAVQKRQKEGEHALCKAGEQGLSLGTGDGPAKSLLERLGG